jgi:hypothetical protein
MKSMYTECILANEYRYINVYLFIFSGNSSKEEDNENVVDSDFDDLANVKTMEVKVFIWYINQVYISYLYFY